MNLGWMGGVGWGEFGERLRKMIFFRGSKELYNKRKAQCTYINEDLNTILFVFIQFSSLLA